MRLALDYDDTFTKDPELWLDFIAKANSRGHEIIMVTMRTWSECRELDHLLDKGIASIHPTYRKAKKPYLVSLGLTVDVWIDDSPHWILEDAT